MKGFHCRLPVVGIIKSVTVTISAKQIFTPQDARLRFHTIQII